MLKGLERSIATIDRRLVLVAPPHVRVSTSFENVTVDPNERERLVREMQQLRGRVYLEDGAVQPHHLTPEGLHETPEDAASWHLLFVDAARRVTACIWYMEHDDEVSYDALRVKHTPLARMKEWREALWSAVASDLAVARQEELKFAEVGGWAVAKESRCSAEGLLLALAAYSLGSILGGALGITTATIRHSSSAILRRLGGALLESDGVALPSYYDPKYQCQMEILRFDSRKPSTKYAGIVDLLTEKLCDVPTIAALPSLEEYRPAPVSWTTGTVSLTDAALAPA